MRLRRLLHGKTKLFLSASRSWQRAAHVKIVELGDSTSLSEEIISSGSYVH